jgi:hypothetical protein
VKTTTPTPTTAEAALDGLLACAAVGAALCAGHVLNVLILGVNIFTN